MTNVTNSQPARVAASAPAAARLGRPKPTEPDRVLYEEERARRTAPTFTLRGSKSITSVVQAHGAFMLDVQTPAGRVLLYKHGVDLVEIANSSALRPPRPGPTSPPASLGPVRPLVGGGK